MTLEDFEKSLAEERRLEEDAKPRHVHKKPRRRHERGPQDEERNGHRHKRRRHSRDGHGGDLRGDTSTNQQIAHEDEGQPGVGHFDGVTVEKNVSTLVDRASPPLGLQRPMQRDTWMEEPSTSDIRYTHKPRDHTISPTGKFSKANSELKVHEMEMNRHHLQNLSQKSESPGDVEDGLDQGLDYQFGDAGSQWRMTKLKGVYRRAQETKRSLDEVAADQYGDLRAFDDAREEQTELDRRDTYGDGYVGKDKPSGELFQERKMATGSQIDHIPPGDNHFKVQNFSPPPQVQEPSLRTVSLAQTALNRLKAQMLKAKVRGSSDAASLEAQYNLAAANLANQTQSEVVVLGTMENRLLAGSRQGEVTSIDNKRGRARGLVEENEDMSVEDMVKQERRTRHQPGGDGQRFAERIAKDPKFDNDLDYMDENANRLAKRVQKSEINLKDTAISDFQKMNKILDNCPLCHHEDSDTPPVAPVVSLATRVYLTLPTEPEISDGGACIIPLQHRGNLLECDDDEWEEIRNFMKSLTRMYHDQGRDVVFYENAAAPHRKKHAGMEVVPLPYSLGETAPAFFKEAILTADEEWTQHRKLIDTLSKAKQGLGKTAFRRTLAKEMPYFHVWFEMDGGLGHVVEDANRWPKGDLFAREVIGGILDKGPDVIKRQGRWSKGGDRRVEGFRKRWKQFDWTRVLTDVQE